MHLFIHYALQKADFVSVQVAFDLLMVSVIKKCLHYYLKKLFGCCSNIFYLQLYTEQDKKCEAISITSL